MTAYTSTDKRPVIFCSDREPAPSGSYLKYCEVGTTDLKGIVDLNGDPVANPVLVDSASRPEYQVFLGEGQYTVYLYRYNGDGTSYAPIYYSEDHQWVEQGAPPPDNTSSYGLQVVETIDDLRGIDGTLVKTIMLTGYWTAGDKPAILYTWDDDTLIADDGGYAIRVSGVTPGAWIAKPNQKVDVRDYGLIPGKSGVPFMGRAQNAEAYAALNSLPIYFSRGTYEVSEGTYDLPVHAILDPGVDFKNTSSGTFFIDFQSTIDISVDAPFKNSLSTGEVFPMFSGDYTDEVSMKWFGWAPGTTNHGVAFKAACDYTSSAHPLIVSGGELNVGTLTADANCYNNLIFRLAGRLRCTLGGSYFINMRANEIFNQNYVNGATTKCLVDTGLNLPWIKWYDAKPLRTSFWGTADFSLIAQRMNSSILNSGAAPQSFIIDGTESVSQPVTFTNPLTYAQNSNIEWSYESGYCTSSAAVCLTSMMAHPLAKIFTGTIAVGSQVTYTNWWNTIQNAMASAVVGRSILDFNGRSYTMSAGVTVSSITHGPTSNKQAAVFRNGQLDVGGATNYAALYLNVAYNDIRFESMTVNTYLGVHPTVRTAGVVNKIVFDDCSLNQFNDTSLENCIVDHYGTYIGELRFNRCSIAAMYLTYFNYSVQGSVNTYLTDCPSVYCKTSHYGGRFWASNCYFTTQGAAGYYLDIHASTTCEVHNNVFDGLFLQLANPLSTAVLYGHVTHNKFISTVNQLASIPLVATMSDVIVKGLIITDNEFSGYSATQQYMINWAEVGGSFALATLEHTYLVTNNVSSYYNLLVRASKGRFIAYFDGNFSGPGQDASVSLWYALPETVLTHPDGTMKSAIATATPYSGSTSGLEWNVGTAYRGWNWRPWATNWQDVTGTMGVQVQAQQVTGLYVGSTGMTIPMEIEYTLGGAV